MTDSSPLPRAVDLVPDSPTEPTAPAGVTRPWRRGGGARFLTDVLVDLGFVPADRVQRAIDDARQRGGTPERFLLDEHAITAEQSRQRQ